MPASLWNCRRCPLWTGRLSIVDGAGPVNAPLMIVGEAPGENEDKSGVPFVGSSGRLLRNTVLELAPMLPVFFTNSVRCRPPGNRDPLDGELRECRTWLEEEILRVKPKVILAAGKYGAIQVNEVLKELVATHRDDGLGEIEVKYSLHPAAVMQGRSLDKRGKFREQVKEAVYEAEGKIYHHPGVIPEEWEYVDESELERVIFPWSEWTALDTETDTLDDGIGNSRVGWSASDGRRAVFTTSDPSRYIAHIPHMYLHNAAYDLPQLEMDPWDFPAWNDTMLMVYVLRLWERVGLKECGPKITGVPMEPISNIIGSGKNQIKFSEALERDYEKASRYAAKDALVTSRIAKAVVPMLRAEPKLQWYYDNIEKPLVPIIIGMHERGVKIDREALGAVAKDIQDELGKTEGELREILGTTKKGVRVIREMDNWTPSRLPAALKEFGLEFKHKTPTGKPQQDKAALLEMAQVDREEELDPENNIAHLIVSKLLTRRTMEKLQGTYIEGIEARLDRDDVLRGRFNQAITATNRLSSADPNLQNIPARTPLGKRIRSIFVAREGYALLRADYSQAELRVFADYTRDPLFVGAYPWLAPAKDLHQEVADRFAQWGVPRKEAKNGVFGAIYGAEEEKLAVTFGVPKSKAGAFLDDLRKQAPALVNWRPYIHNLLLKQGYVETLLGWRNYYPLVYSPIENEVQAAIREAANLPIQGTVAGIVKVLMIEGRKLAAEYAAHLILQVHDEVVYEVPRQYTREFGERLALLGHEIGKRWIKAVPMELTWNVGANWRDAA